VPAVGPRPVDKPVVADVEDERTPALRGSRDEVQRQRAHVPERHDVRPGRLDRATQGGEVVPLDGDGWRVILRDEEEPHRRTVLASYRAPGDAADRVTGAPVRSPWSGGEHRAFAGAAPRRLHEPEQLLGPESPHCASPGATTPRLPFFLTFRSPEARRFLAGSLLTSSPSRVRQATNGGEASPETAMHARRVSARDGHGAVDAHVPRGGPALSRRRRPLSAGRQRSASEARSPCHFMGAPVVCSPKHSWGDPGERDAGRHRPPGARPGHARLDPTVTLWGSDATRGWCARHAPVGPAPSARAPAVGTGRRAPARHAAEA
jgi:hypothetical protein